MIPHRPVSCVQADSVPRVHELCEQGKLPDADQRKLPKLCQQRKLPDCPTPAVSTAQAVRLPVISCISSVSRQTAWDISCVNRVSCPTLTSVGCLTA